MKTISESLGGHYGASTRIITEDGTEWHFVFDVPRMVAELEQLSLQWHRDHLKKVIESIPDYNVAGSWGSGQADREFAEYKKNLEAGEFSPPRFDPATGLMIGGTQHAAWLKTPDGGLSALLAAMRIKHPSATYATVRTILTERPIEAKAVMIELGKAVQATAIRQVAALAERDPAAASVAAKAMEGAIESLSQEIAKHGSAA